MLDQIHFPLKRGYLGSSDNGLVLYWLRSVPQVNLTTAITLAMRIVYLPSALGANRNDWGRFYEEQEQSRREFEKWMSLTDGVDLMKIPDRININLTLRFPSGSDNGKTLNWMLENYGNRTASQIIEAVRLVYLPKALNAYPKGRDRAELEVWRSKIFFSDRRASDHLPPLSEFRASRGNNRTEGRLTLLESPENRTPEYFEREPLSTRSVALQPKEDEDEIDKDFVDIDLDAIY